MTHFHPQPAPSLISCGLKRGSRLRFFATPTPPPTTPKFAFVTLCYIFFYTHLLPPPLFALRYDPHKQHSLVCNHRKNHIMPHTTLDTRETLATLRRLNETAKIRRLCVNAMLRASREAGSLETLRGEIERMANELTEREQHLISRD